jgi:hypothetical protein
MKDYLQDLVGHTLELGCIDLIKIMGTDKATSVLGVAEDRSVVVEGRFHNPIPEFIGTFGMPQLSKLKTILNLSEYQENANLTVTRKKDTNDPDGITFANSSGDFRNSYRFMVADIVNDKLKSMTFKEPTWHVEIEPNVAGIQRLKMQAQANAEESLFQCRTDKGDLKFFFGDHSTHAGEFVFHPGVTGDIKRAWNYPVRTVISILDLVGDKVMKISDDGVAQITVDSGLAVYRYILLAQTK